MSKSRMSTLILALLVSAIALFAAGCGSSDDDGTRGGGGGEKLTVGSDVPYPPFEEFGKSKTEFQGFDIELMEAIAKKLGREVEFKDTSFDTIFRDLAQGKFDAVASATTITDEREESVDFTNPYYLPSAQSIVVVKGATGLDSAKDLEGKVVGVQQGTTGQEYVEEEIDTKELRTYPQGPDTIPALKAGTIDAVVIDRPVAENAIEADSGIEISGGIETEEQYGFVVQQGDEELLDELNEGLAEVIDSGEYKTIYTKWFHKPVPAGIGTTTHEAT
ncbi:MAG TPA: basic amino acid ABC transporter substrate-binding protein [Solirubrobacterales bacterium]|nr:basic amino acid ABC transporter substrate-binding protein [Solirubrobacterales bacterium]